MGETVLRVNLAAIARWDASLATAIGAADGPSPLIISASRTGAPTAQLNGVWLHSRYDPEKEAERIVPSLSGNATLIVLGFGLGWIPEHIARSSTSTVSIVLEPSAAALRTALAERDLSAVLRSGRMRLTTSSAGLGAIIEAVHLPAIRDGVAVHTLAGRTEAGGDEEIFAVARRTITAVLASKAAELATIRRFGVAWFSHTLTNSRTFPWDRQRAAVTALLDRLAPDRTATIVGAGPSLTSHALAGRPIGPLVSVDTAVPTLRALNVVPDVVVSLDPQGWSVLHFRNRLPDEAILVADIGVSPRVISAAARTVAMSSHHPLHLLMEHAGFPLLPPGAAADTVAEAAVALAPRGSGRHPHLIGVDGAYPRGETYARGTYHHILAQQRARRLTPAEEFFSRSVYPRMPEPVPDESNRPVFASEGLRAARERVLRRAVAPSAPAAAPVTVGEHWPDPCAFWEHHATELLSAARRLESTEKLCTPQVLATIGPHGAAHLPLLAALRWRFERSLLGTAPDDLLSGLEAGGSVALTATLRCAATRIRSTSP